MEQEDQKNMVIAVVLMIAILIGWEYFVAPHFAPPKPPVSAQAVQGPAAAQSTAAPSGAASTAIAPGAGPAPTAIRPRAEILAETPRVPIDTPRLHGSISLVGARLDDLTLATYHETVDPKSPEIELLSPSGSDHAYMIDLGWVPDDKSVAVPDDMTRWTETSQGSLTADHPVALSWDNGTGLIFTRQIAIDADYMFTITQSVANHGTAPVTLRPYGSVARSGAPPVSPTYLLHVGAIGVLEGRLKEIKYAAIKDAPPTEAESTGGWLGFNDKYWLAAVIPDQSEAVKSGFRWTGSAELERYQADYIGDNRTIAPGASAVSSSRVFAGAKEVKLLDRYEADLGIPLFDHAIDFGTYFYWLTKPIFLALDFINGKIGNFGLSIMLLTLLIKILFFPLANNSYRAMGKMKQLQPEIQKLREKYGEDKAKINQEVMALYKRVGANPMAGCLPILVQIPVFFSLYKVLYVTIEMRQAPFYGWVHDLSAPDPTTWLNLFSLLPYNPSSWAPHALMLGAWPLIMGVTMFLQQKLNPAPADPVQAKMMMALPLVFTFMLGQFPAGLVIYWAWNNSLSITQQWLIMRRARTP